MEPPTQRGGLGMRTAADPCAEIVSRLGRDDRRMTPDGDALSSPLNMSPGVKNVTPTHDPATGGLVSYQTYQPRNLNRDVLSSPLNMWAENRGETGLGSTVAIQSPHPGGRDGKGVERKRRTNGE